MAEHHPKWLQDIGALLKSHGQLIRIMIIASEGSTPREIGTAMLVGASDIWGTIGGGTLEYEAIKTARQMLLEARQKHVTPLWQSKLETLPLGPALGQCCGGVIRLAFMRYSASEYQVLSAQMTAPNGLLVHPLRTGSPPQYISNRAAYDHAWPLALTKHIRAMLSGAQAKQPIHIKPRKQKSATHESADLPQSWFIEPIAQQRSTLYLYGAGHVGRALIHVLRDLPFTIHWVDTARPRFPDIVPDYAQIHVAPNPTEIAAQAEPNALHLIMTFSHALDLALCHTILARQNFKALGLIGSQTKRARFYKKLRQAGLTDQDLARLTCPIGLELIQGKEPPIIAIAVAGQLIQWHNTSSSQHIIPSSQMDQAL